MADTNAEQERTSEEPASSPGRLLAAKKAAKAAKKAAKRGRQAEMRETEALRVGAQVSTFLQENRRALLGAVVALVVVGAGITAYMLMSSQEDREATEMLWEAARAATAPVEGDGAGAADETFTSAGARATAATERFGRVLEQHPRSRASVWAHLGLGTARLQANDPDGAIEAYQAALDKADSVVQRWRAREGMAFAHELREGWDEAAKQYEAIKALDDARVQLQADYHLARLDFVRGNEDAALAALKKTRDALRDDDAPDLPYLSEQVDALIRHIDPEALPAAVSGGGQPQLSPEEMQELMRRLQAEGGLE
jgi:tetratricopeptide (TPR) repeat protein